MADGITKINDNCAIVGDEVLKEIAAVLKSAVREDDQVVRYGGDESC